jgi:hypothetical protein
MTSGDTKLTRTQPGLSDAEWDRLLHLKQEVASGVRNEDPLHHPRVAFIKYLIERGNISG